MAGQAAWNIFWAVYAITIGELVHAAIPTVLAVVYWTEWRELRRGGLGILWGIPPALFFALGPVAVALDLVGIS